MTDPNQRSRRHGKPMTARDTPSKKQGHPQKGYFDSNGYFHTAAQNSAGQPGLNPAGQQKGQPVQNTAGHPAAAPQPQNRRNSPPKKHRGALFLVKSFLLIALCLSVGLFLHYMIGKDSYGANGANGTNGTKTAITAVNHSVVTPAFTGSALPYTKPITFSSDTAKPLYGKVIILDPGHGGTDSGCVYPTNKPKYSENVINLTIAESTRAALEAQGATVIMLRSDDSWISLYQRIALTHFNCLQYADEFGIETISSSDKARLVGELSDTVQVNSDTIDTGGMGIMVGTGVGSDLRLLMDLEKNLTDILYLSIHTNSNPAASLHGTQVYYVTDDSVISSEVRMVADDTSYQNNPNFPIRGDYYGRNDARNELFAQSLYDSIVAAAPNMETNAQSVLADNYAVLREHNLTGAMIEVGFITNKKDRGYLTEDSSIAQIANGIATGCINFFAGNT